MMTGASNQSDTISKLTRSALHNEMDSVLRIMSHIASGDHGPTMAVGMFLAKDALCKI